MSGQIEDSVVVDDEAVIVIRSAKRRRTVTGDLVAGQLRLRVPMRLGRADVEAHARAFRKRLVGRSGHSAASDEQLLTRAQELAVQYFEGSVQPRSVSWSSRQLKRWGSTTSTTGSIRLSARLQNMPGWVVDSVLVHELAHLIEPDHGERFQQLVARYRRTAEADAFLAGVSWAEQHLVAGD
ncbi:SprT-like domain-containing protein [Garicola koreensis]|uniref:YgjP-like metallopeptidase domain-containing protein n=1 Tax=Garicola koreensis TaxID=1262554 RepID=A0A7W5XKN8_9MICC|nr:hypothetical protein [Garicola koreensis]